LEGRDSEMEVDYVDCSIESGGEVELSSKSNQNLKVEEKGGHVILLQKKKLMAKKKKNWPISKGKSLNICFEVG